MNILCRHLAIFCNKGFWFIHITGFPNFSCVFAVKMATKTKGDKVDAHFGTAVTAEEEPVR